MPTSLEELKKDYFFSIVTIINKMAREEQQRGAEPLRVLCSVLCSAHSQPRGKSKATRSLEKSPFLLLKIVKVKKFKFANSKALFDLIKI